MTKAELNELIDAVLDGVCSEADFVRLEAELHVDPEARQAYYERLKLHTALQLESGERADSKIVTFPNWRRNLPWYAGIAAALLLLVAGSLGWQLGRGRRLRRS